MILRSMAAKKGDGVSYTSLLDEIVGCGDMVLLDPPSQDKVVENLKLRYKEKDIYVSQCGICGLCTLSSQTLRGWLETQEPPQKMG